MRTGRGRRLAMLSGGNVGSRYLLCRPRVRADVLRRSLYRGHAMKTLERALLAVIIACTVTTVIAQAYHVGVRHGEARAAIEMVEEQDQQTEAEQE